MRALRAAWMGSIAFALLATGCAVPPAMTDSSADPHLPLRRVVIVSHEKRWPIPGLPESTPPEAAPLPVQKENGDIQIEIHAPTSQQASSVNVIVSPRPTPVPASMPVLPHVAATQATDTQPATLASPIVEIVAAPETRPATVPLPVQPVRIEPGTQPSPLHVSPPVVTHGSDSAPIRVLAENPTALNPSTQSATQAVAVATPAKAAESQSADIPAIGPRATGESRSQVAVSQDAAGWALTLLFLLWILLTGAAGSLAARRLASTHLNGIGHLRDKMLRRRYEPADVWVGALTALLVPLVLGLVASDLLLRARMHKPDLLVALALCFGVGMGSRFLANSIQRQMLGAFQQVRADAEAAGTKADAARGEMARATALIGALVESQVDIDSDSLNGDTDARMSQTAKAMEEDEADVLSAMAKGPDRFRSESGLASRSELSVNDVQEVLNVLEREGYAGRVVSPRTGERLWYLTRQGRKLAATRYIV